MERDFKGVWISKEVWLDKRLNALEKVILVEIDSLDCNDVGCFASNDYLSEFCQCSLTKISLGIKKLMTLGYIYQASFDGRTRVLKSRLSKNERQDFKNLNADFKNLKGDKYNNNNINNNIDYNNNISDNDTRYVSCHDTEIVVSLILNDGTNYDVTKEEFDLYQKCYPAVNVKQSLNDMAGWLYSNPKNRKTRNGIKRFINSWLSRNQDNAPKVVEPIVEVKEETKEEPKENNGNGWTWEDLLKEGNK